MPRAKKTFRAVDGNHAVASVAYRASEVIAIYPITPSSPMGEACDEWAARGEPNLWGAVPKVVEMQSEAGAAGAIHGALQAGALATSFTASQGLLLMIPNLYKIAGELTPFCLHVAARTIATHALSIFGDHSDVMACRQTGFAMLCSNSVQEAHDFAAIAHAATLRSRVPFLHFMDGFRTSHEIAKLEELNDDVLHALITAELRDQHRQRALTPDRPVLRGTAQNPDTFFQAREAANPYYELCPSHVQIAMDFVADRTGRAYHLFDYVGHEHAREVVVAMGSGAETMAETVRSLAARGERVGLIKVRLYRPFFTPAFLAALPKEVTSIAVLDRTKEPGAPGEPLFLDVVAAIREGVELGTGPDARVVGGRYGLSSKEFTPAMARAVIDNLHAPFPKRRFTVGIVDDVTGTSLSVPHDPDFDIEPRDVKKALFYGLGSDGTVGAVKSVVTLLCEDPHRWAQSYFEYDSKKAGAMTVSHLRWAQHPIHAPYLVRDAGFVACHHFNFLDRIDVLDGARDGAIFLVNAPGPATTLWDRLPREVQETIVAKHLKLWTIDADAVAREAGIPGRINGVLETCFLVLAELFDREQAVTLVNASIETTYGKKSSDVVRRNQEAVTKALAALVRIDAPEAATTTRSRPPLIPSSAPDFVQGVTAALLARQGDLLPVSAFPVDGSWPLGTAKYERRNLADEIPVWDPDICIQCNKCALVCPHAAIRAKVYDPAQLATAPEGFKSTPYRGLEHTGLAYTIQVAPEDCTGCTLCIRVCPAKDRSNPRHKALDSHPQPPLVDGERRSYDFFLALPEVDRAKVHMDVKGTQLLQPLFEYSGACVGCGETPYVKLLTQLYGDRALIANATGCSSIYGGNLPTTPYTTDGNGRGPAWSNSLFEDNAEFGLGMRLAVDGLRDRARYLVTAMSGDLGDQLVTALLAPDGDDEGSLAERRSVIAALRRRLPEVHHPGARELASIADYLARKSVWIVGGDGWAYDIGFGGVDHVLASGANVNILVLDTEVYSNTGGQQSKATPLGATAKFASAGKSASKKDVGLIAMTYGNVYVGRVAFGAKDTQTVKTFREAEAYPGPSIILAYSPCIAHGYDLAFGLDQQHLAVETGHWPLYRFDPRLLELGQNPLSLDSKKPRRPIADFARNEARFRMVERQDPMRFRDLMARASVEARNRFSLYEQIAHLQMRVAGATEAAPSAVAADEPKES